MRRLQTILRGGHADERRNLIRALLGPGLLWCLFLAGCAATVERSAEGTPAADMLREDPGAMVPISLQFVTVHQNDRDAPYYPFEGLAGLAYHDDGTLYVCDELGGRVHAWSAARNQWFEFNSPGSRYFRPTDIKIDGFNALVLDEDDREILRYDLGGVFLDRLVDFTYLDPGYDRVPSAFDVDLEGRFVITDSREHQVLVLDSFLAINETIGGPGKHQGRFDDPQGVVFLNDGSVVVSDRANRRLQRFARNGAFDMSVGSYDEVNNPLLTPQGIDCDEYDNLFVADPAAGAVHVFSAELNYLFSLGDGIPLYDTPIGPVDVAVGPDATLAVSDRSGQAVLIYRIMYR